MCVVCEATYLFWEREYLHACVATNNVPKTQMLGRGLCGLGEHGTEY